MICWLPVIKKIQRETSVRAKGQSGKDTNIIIFLPLPILGPWGTMMKEYILDLNIIKDCI